MSTSLIASLRKQLPSIYGEYLPDDIRYRDADGHDVVVALDAATVDELSFAIQTANAEALALGRRRVDAGCEHGAGEAAAVHVHQLVDQHIARGADVACKAVAPAQQQGLAVSAAVGEFGELQFHALHAFERAGGHDLSQFGVIRNLQGFLVFSARG